MTLARTRTYRPALALVALALPLTLAACGSDDSSGDSDSSGSDSSDSGDSGSSDDSQDVAKPEDLCTVVSAEAVSGVVGGPVTGETAPFGACTFSSESRDGAYLLAGVSTEAEVGGSYEAYVSGISTALTITGEDTPDVGDGAIVKIGGVAGTESRQVAGAAKVGNLVATVNLTPGAGVSDADALTQAGQILKLIADAL